MSAIEAILCRDPLLTYREAEGVVQQERLGAGHHQRGAAIAVAPGLLLAEQHTSAEYVVPEPEPEL